MFRFTLPVCGVEHFKRAHFESSEINQIMQNTGQLIQILGHIVQKAFSKKF